MSTNGQTAAGTYDAVVLGGGPNGLVCAAYLARAGARVALVERRHETGGGLNTDEYAGFRFNLHAVYHLMSDVMPAWRDLDLARLGVRYLYPHVVAAFPLGPEQALVFTRDHEETAASIAALDPHDADCFRRMMGEFEPMLEQYLVPMTYELPNPALDQILEFQQTEVGTRLAEISELSFVEMLDEYGFRDPRVRMALLTFAAMWGLHLDDPLGYLYPIYLGRMLRAGLVQGGSHRLSSAIFRAFVGAGGEVLDACEAVRIGVDGGRAVAVETADGRSLATRAVVSTLNPVQTFLDLVGDAHLPAALADAVRGWEWEERTLFGLHLGIEGDVVFRNADPRVGEAMIAFLGPETDDALQEHLARVDAGEADGSEHVHVTVASRFDPTMAPPGHHVLRAESVVRYDGDWSDDGRALGDRCLERIAGHADLGRVVLRRDCPPTHIAQRLTTMARGSIKHGAYTPLQMGYLRPNDECSRITTPVDGLFVAGASVYPGGMILGGPGYLGAQVVADHLALHP